MTTSFQKAAKQENRVARKTGGTRNAGSGSGWKRRHDVRSHGREGYLWEMKFTGKKQITLKDADLESVRKIARTEGRTPLVHIEMNGRRWVMQEEDDFFDSEPLSDDELRERHKRAHGLTPENEAWYDPRFGVGREWDIIPGAFRD